jgi:hypothetical protein
VVLSIQNTAYTAKRLKCAFKWLTGGNIMGITSLRRYHENREGSETRYQNVRQEPVKAVEEVEPVIEVDTAYKVEPKKKTTKKTSKE